MKPASISSRDTNHRRKRRRIAATLCALACALPAAVMADTSFTINDTIADAFLAAGSAANPVGANLTGLNFGSAGTLAIAPASSTKGEFDSVIMFTSAGAFSQFNATYGPGNWQITGLTLSLSSNFPMQGSQPMNMIFNKINAGSFGVDLLSDNSWVEGTGGGMGSPSTTSVTFNSIPTLLSGTVDSLGTFTYTPPGNTSYLNYTLPLNPDLVTDTSAGGDLSLYFYAADNQVGYLFNSKEFASGHPELTVTAAATPEPAATTLMAGALGSLWFLARRRKTGR
jgi:hypothetical protein